MQTDELLRLSQTELLKMAQEKRAAAFGNRITFSPKVFIPLTKLCLDRCGYCTFAEPPARVKSPYMAIEEVLKIARAGAQAGCTEVLFTLGERPEDRYPAAKEWLQKAGYSSTVDYLIAVAKIVTQETGLLAHSNAGALNKSDLSQLRKVAPSQGMMIESLNPNLDCHKNSPDKTPERRLTTLNAAGELAIPFTTGILVGIGETEMDRIDALTAIVESHLKYGHIQEVIVQNFLPKPGTAMHLSPACPEDTFLETIALARLILPQDVHLQAPPNLSQNFAQLLDAGIDDWGGVSPLTPDFVNPERPWPDLDRLQEITEAAGFSLAPRLTIYPEFAISPDRWQDPEIRFAVMELSDSEGLAREPLGHKWYSGAPVDPPDLLNLAASAKRDAVGPVAEVLAGVELRQEVGTVEMEILFSARGTEAQAVMDLADSLRAETCGDEVTWVSNRNINYTNVCTYKCKFCGFSKGPLSLNLRGEPYLLELEEIASRAKEAWSLGATEVCLQGGIHPSFTGEYYIDVTRTVKEAVPDIHVHGFTALEVTEGARRLSEPLESYLLRLKEAGLRSLPGTAAEILDDPIREIICPDKINTEEWLEAHRTAHKVGLSSNVTIMFGTVETPASWARHIHRTRKLQKETGGFTEFVGLPFVHMAAPIYLQKKSRRGPTFREAVLMHSVARIAYRGCIDNIQASWVKLGMQGAAQVLQAGGNDLGGTLINENISRAAGAEHGQMATPQDFREIVKPLGRTLVQRSTLYNRQLVSIGNGIKT